MMSKWISVLLLGSLLGASGRTWTSADGSETFEGELVSYSETKQTATVLIDKKERVFPLDELSKVDRLWAKKNAVPRDESLTLPGILTKDVLTKLEDGQFVPAEIKGQPKYYLVYFSASW